MDPKTKNKNPAKIKTEPDTNIIGIGPEDSKPSHNLEDFPPIDSKELKVWLEVSKLAREPLMTMDELKKEL
ncbi:hypothetical protein G7Z17_g6908 [Cylindrodendrum hubeiense]|uniref:Uncharacterized protein n=1 Tax=Cylindrodendrum hubeiense TaxID=595255 RepID=A0A9P5HE86_9HYPO|nr:hypothetical protein G7Z17_g6908 [Cylindrodendrum hubeiense]